MKLENTKKPYIKSLKGDKKDNQLNISMPSRLSKRLQLTSYDYTKIYVDDTNNLCLRNYDF
jgi:hypothetical protein